MTREIASVRRPGRPLGVSLSAVPEFTARRLALGLGTVAIARHLTESGIPTKHTSVVGWESGDFHPSELRVELLAAVLRVPVSTVELWFLEAAQNKRDSGVEAERCARRAS